ncbi:hypothetical protein ALO61_200113 [Pseudomonas savastanoi pv. nerii]|nr:hypothetical protein ALO61_200113 [Pseudomonas savastanoi pv. nerii]KPY74928.1 hypothetical protein ALO58_200165 [Pseudomonas savastanoi pv. savastanoi]
MPSPSAFWCTASIDPTNEGSPLPLAIIRPSLCSRRRMPSTLTESRDRAIRAVLLYHSLRSEELSLRLAFRRSE